MQACALDLQGSGGVDPVFLQEEEETPQEEVWALSGSHVHGGNPE